MIEATVALAEAPDALSADAAIGDELSDSWTAWGESWGDAWGFSWGVFNEPYPSLSPGVRLFVLAELHKLFVQFEVEQIIAVAESNNLSVLRAASALSMVVSVEDDQLSVIQRPSELSVSAVRAQTEATQKDKPNRITARSSLPPNEVFVARSMGRMTVMAAKARQYVVI